MQSVSLKPVTGLTCSLFGLCTGRASCSVLTLLDPNITRPSTCSVCLSEACQYIQMMYWVLGQPLRPGQYIQMVYWVLDQPLRPGQYIQMVYWVLDQPLRPGQYIQMVYWVLDQPLRPCQYIQMVYWVLGRLTGCWASL